MRVQWAWRADAGESRLDVAHCDLNRVQVAGTVLSPVAFNELAAPSVYLVRGAPALLDEDVARFFGVNTSRLNEQVKRNLDRFGGDFASRHIDDQYRQLVFLAKQLRMVIEIQRDLDTGAVEGLLTVPKDLGG